MKNFLKSTLVVLLAVVMTFGVYLPMSGVALFDSFSVQASAASVSSTTTGKFVIFLPAGVKMYSCSSVTGSTNSTPYFHHSSKQLTIYATEKCVLSNGNVRFLITADTVSGERTLYYQLPSSASAYQLPDAPSSISNSGRMCNNQYCNLEWNTTSYVDFYIVEVYDSNGSYVYGGYIYPSSNGKNLCDLDFSDRIVYGELSIATFNVSITPVREINNSWYYGYKGVYNNVKFGSCQPVYSRGIYGINYNANGGYGGPSTQNWSNPCSGYTTLTSSVPSRTGYTFLGWSTSSTATQPTYYPGSSVYFDHDQLWLYAVWSKIPTYTVSYNANGGLGAPSAQTKTKDTTLWLSSTKPTKSYTVTYNANGGSVSPSSKTVSCTFKNWNTAQNGSGTSYSSGASYSANSGVTLYAQWTNPTYGTLPTPTRTGYTFSGWYTSTSGGTKITSSSTVSSSTTLYAHWTKVAEENGYNLGEETYSFSNFSDRRSNGYCFGMSITSSGYHTGELDVSKIGIDSSDKLYTLNLTSTVKEPISYYQPIQGDYSKDATVAGGTNYINDERWNITSDWSEVVDYVKNHNFDGKGSLQIGFRKVINGITYGHAINFLRYEKVNGQDRLYAYDNNYPNTETYFYMDSNGNVLQYPASTFPGSIDCIALRSVKKYFDLVPNYDSTRYVYATRNSIMIEGIDEYLLDGVTEMGDTVMFEIPENVNQITITPLVDNATFEYLDESYSFGNVGDDTVGVLTLVSSDDNIGTQSPGFEIENEAEISLWKAIVRFFKALFELIFLPITIWFK